MCGIAGAIGLPSETSLSLVSQMQEVLGHRGPDDSGLQRLQNSEPSVVFTHTRLAVLDLSPAGHQPMSEAPPGASTRRNWITYNGEIYNFRQLRDELKSLGHAFHSRSDTEVILKAYRQWGERAAEKLEGMFAFALWDNDSQQVHLCRDRMGIKPLYFYRSARGGFFFASEVRALLSLGSSWLPRHLNSIALEGYLARGAVWGDQSLVAGIEALEPGHWMSVGTDGKQVSSKKYWNLSGSLEARSTLHRKEAVQGVRTCLERAVRDHMVSDVPVGLFLSGGIDSSALAILAQQQSMPLELVTLGFPDEPVDEEATAVALARSLNLPHQVVRFTGTEILKHYPGMLSAMDQPSMDGFNTYLVSKAVRDLGIKVVLSGLGGDELFGGYPSFTQVPAALRLRQLTQPFQAFSWGREWMGKLPSLFFRKLSQLSQRPSYLTDLYLLRRELFLPTERRALTPLPSGVDSASGMELSDLEQLRRTVATLDSQNQISFLELNTYMRHVLLRDSDVFSMAHGLELRLPFLDSKLVQLVRSLRGQWKRPRAYSKPLLVDAVAKLPPSIFKKKKKGFELPWQTWMRGPLNGLFAETLNAHSVWKDLGIGHTLPAKLWRDYGSRSVQSDASKILTLFNLAHYCRKHGLRA